MRKSAIIIIMSAALGSCSGETADAGAPMAGLEAANAAYDRALIDGDATRLAGFYTDDYTIIDDDAGINGKQDQIRTMTELVDLLEGRSDDIKVTPLGPNAALLTGRLRGRYRAGGEENSFTERYTSVWVRQGGGWKIRHEHASLVPEPQPPESRTSS